MSIKDIFTNKVWNPIKMRRCPYCHKLTTRGNFCIYCGKQLNKHVKSYSVRDQICPNCLRSVPRSDNFCIYCGTQLNAVDHVALQHQVNKTRQKRSAVYTRA